jgi:hypothetical protein
MSTAQSSATDREPRRARVRRLLPSTNLLTSVILVFPLFLFYQFCVLFLPNVGNGADFITFRLVALLHHSANLYLALNLGLTLAFVGFVLVLRRRQEFNAALFLPVTVESAVYALTMGTLILYVMSLLGIDPSLDVGKAAAAPASGGLLTRIALAVGAGVHEELVFRLILLTAVVALLHQGARVRRWLSVALGFVITSLLFSAAHHVIGGEPWRIGPFVYRFFCGLIFASLFQWRGFAVAVYTHALYDIYVMVLH